MIDALLDIFNVALDAPVSKRHGVATGNPPRVWVGGKEYAPASNDKDGLWSYWRVGTIQTQPENAYKGCRSFKHVIPLRYVILVDSGCGYSGLMTTLGTRIRNSLKEARLAIGAELMSVMSMSSTFEGVDKQEGVDVRLGKVLLAIDFTLSVSGDCMPTCGDPVNILCVLIGRATDGEIIECLGERINAICTEQPCDPPTSDINVTTLGVPAAIGRWTYEGEVDGKGVWSFVDPDDEPWSCFNVASTWVLQRDDVFYAYYGLDAPTPWESTWIDQGGAPNPQPVIVSVCEGDCLPVTIIDQNDNVLEEVAAGGSYQVFVLDSINDEPPYEEYIINDNG